MKKTIKTIITSIGKLSTVYLVTALLIKAALCVGFSTIGMVISIPAIIMSAISAWYTAGAWFDSMCYILWDMDID